MKRAFGNVLYELRMEANLTQVDLAKSSGLSQSAVSRLESGYRWPELKTMKRISYALNITVENLMTMMVKELGKPDAKHWESLKDDEEDDENE